MMGVGEGADVVRKETTPDVQAALASTTDGCATRAGRQLDVRAVICVGCWWGETAGWLGWPLVKLGLGNDQQ